MDRLMYRVRPDSLAVFKLDITQYSPSEDQACPWVWECRGLAMVAEYCASGSGTTWEQAWARGRTHAERKHGVNW